jgi:dTDP-4-dehydrorhamnose reductase
MKVLVTGAGGMLARDVIGYFTEAKHDVIMTDRGQLDITDEAAVHAFVQDLRPDVVINTAAYNFVDNVESPEHYETALAVNGKAPGYLAQAAKEAGALFIHFSTDYVFAGDQKEGYKEDDVPAPISKYGETKLAGEKAVEAVGGDYYICRLSKIFGRPGTGQSKESYVALMLRLAKEKPSLQIVDEEVGCPTYTKDIAQTVLWMVENRQPTGIYHIVNEGNGVTWYEFAQEFFALKEVKTPYEPVPASVFPRPAKRPAFAMLLNTKLPPLRHRKEALVEFLQELEFVA